MRTVEYASFQILAGGDELSPLYRHRVAYHVRRVGQDGAQVSGVLAGAFDTEEEAEAAAIFAGQLWVDHVAPRQREATEEAKDRSKAKSECTKGLGTSKPGYRCAARDVPSRWQ